MRRCLLMFEINMFLCITISIGGIIMENVKPSLGDYIKAQNN